MKKYYLLRPALAICLFALVAWVSINISLAGALILFSVMGLFLIVRAYKIAIFTGNSETRKAEIIKFVAIILFGGAFLVISPFACVSIIFVISRNGWEVPKESKSGFRETQGSCGNGDYWTYGEDDENYYGMNLDPNHASGTGPAYVILKKGKEPLGFDKFNSDTWGLWEQSKEQAEENKRLSERCKPWR
jgi:hypothetical protein